MEPFSSYRGGGTQELGKLKGGRSRREYALQLCEMGAQPVCAYCGLSLLEPYPNWLLMSVEHVVARKLVNTNGPWANEEKVADLKKWIWDAANCVICCRACNEFAQRMPPDNERGIPESWSAFVSFRDAVFLKKRDHVLRQHTSERATWNENWRRPRICG